jgi:glycosyltransferase involved in cell wall biosynthesis
MLRFGKVDEQTCNLYFTHQNYPIDKELLNRFSQILVMNTPLKTRMVNFGVIESKVKIVYGAVNREVFKPFNYQADKHIGLPETFVLLSSDCKPRKNPEKILSLIKSLPDINFVIHGKGWKIAFEKEISKLKNLIYLDFDYQIQPILMRKAATFMSLSTLEGGPYPLLEALSSGTPVVASRTGFTEDFLNFTNGFIVEHESSLEEIASTLRRSLSLKARLKVQDLTSRNLSWEMLGKHLYSIYF